MKHKRKGRQRMNEQPNRDVKGKRIKIRVVYTGENRKGPVDGLTEVLGWSKKRELC